MITLEPGVEKNGRMKAFVLNEDEHGWKGFLHDKDCCSEIVQRFLPGIRTAKERDMETVCEARDEFRTIVTSNGDHFIREVHKAQKRDINPRCEDCWGLVILPNVDLVREYAMKKVNLRTGVQIGKIRLPWRSVGWANLCVRVSYEGRVSVSRFTRCKFCQRDTPITHAWYDNLRVV
jgi:hypothetical protein